MLISRYEAYKMFHPHFSHIKQYFGSDVLKIIHTHFYPHIDGNNFRELTDTVRRHGVLPYVGDAEILFVAVREPIQEKIDSLQKSGAKQTVIVPVEDAHISFLLGFMAQYYGN